MLLLARATAANAVEQREISSRMIVMMSLSSPGGYSAKLILRGRGELATFFGKKLKCEPRKFPLTALLYTLRALYKIKSDHSIHVTFTRGRFPR